jgi:hypothetical protein
MDVAAICSAGADWPTIWRCLIDGKRYSSAAGPNGYPLAPEVPVSAVPGLDRSVSPGDYGPACRLARHVLARIPARCGRRTRYYGASNHSESDLVVNLSREMPEASPLWESLLVDPMPAYLFHGSGTWMYSACAGGLHALCAASLDLADGKCPEAIVIGVDALSAIGIAGFLRVGATTRGACRPMQTNRDGILIGEGAAAVRLQMTSGHSDSRVRLLGSGMSCDAYHPTDPDPTGMWLEQAIRDALLRAGCDAGAIRAIIAHGTGTAKNDQVESDVYRRLWPQANTPVTSVKGAIGHTMSAAGLFNFLVAFEATRTGLVPPTACGCAPALDGMDLVCHEPRIIPKGGPVLAVALGFGGNNCACVVGAGA